MRSNIFQEINKERDYQDSKWGIDFDNENTINDWATYINIYLAKATSFGVSKKDQRKFMIKVAALSVAALETFDRNGGFADRHYDI